jgi:MFS family permease
MHNTRADRSTFIVIFITIFIDLLGFGIIIPLLPDFSIKVLNISESMIGLVAGIYSLMQFLFTPMWGSLSDKYGRKPILIMSLAGNTLAYSLMALVFSGVVLSLPLLIVARAFAGLFSANISAAQAVVSDITTKESRSKGMGMLGAAFALGFVFGPALGGILSMEFGYGVPIMVSGLFSFIAMILCITIFRETLSLEIRSENKRNSPGITFINYKAIQDVVKNKFVGVYVIIFFFITFSFANIYGTFQLFAERKEGLNLNQAEVGYLLSFLGIVGSIVQSTLIRIFKSKLGEKRALIFGNFLVVFGLALIPFSTSVSILLVIIFILAFGNGINNPITLGLISQNVSREEQGSVLGINQSLSSLARFLGPVWGGFIYEKFGYQFPFITGGFFMLMITVYCIKIFKK